MAARSNGPTRLLLLAALLLILPPPATGRKRAKAPKHFFELPGVFSAEECERIVGAAAAQPQERAVLHDGKDGQRRDVSSRDSTLTWLVRPPEPPEAHLP